MRAKYAGRIDAMVFDPPWGIIPKCLHDVKIPEGDIPVIVQHMCTFLSPQGIIAVRLDNSPIQAAVWAKAMLDMKLHLVYVRIQDTVPHANSRCAANFAKPGPTSNGHQWIIGKKQYRSYRGPAWGTCTLSLVSCLFCLIANVVDVVACCVDLSMSDYPATSADINNVPRGLSSTKLQRKLVVEGEDDRYKPWRTVENSMDELLEILSRYVIPNGKIWDPTCGTGVTALAALRTNRTCVLSDKDGPLVEAMSLRLRWYFSWLKKTYPGRVPNGPPSPNDSTWSYRFDGWITPNRSLSFKNTESMPYFTTAPQNLNRTVTHTHTH